MELKKSEKELPTALQIKNLFDIMNAGGISMLVFPENLDEIKTILNGISKGEKSYDNTTVLGLNQSTSTSRTI